MKFYIETYGCTSNFGNSQDMAEALQKLGHIRAPLDEADIVIVNTCIVTEKTERKILQRLQLLQGERLVVAGCLPAALPESIHNIVCREPQGPLSGPAAERVLDLFGNLPSRSLPAGKTLAHPPEIQDLCGIVNIAEGCNGSCSYCIVRKARGRLVSHKSDDVAKDVEKLVARGIVEVQISAQDTAAYGSDLGTNLADLLERLVQVPGDFRLRVGMMNPNSALCIQEELIRAFQSPKMYQFLHIPVQSGSDRILKSMGRRYSPVDFMKIVNAFRSAYPEMTIITDVIVGFPGETELDFKLTRLWQKIAAQRNRRYQGKVLDALVTEQGQNGTMKARAKNYLGIVVNGRPKMGSLVKVKMTNSNPFYVSGHLEPG